MWELKVYIFFKRGMISVKTKGPNVLHNPLQSVLSGEVPPQPNKLALQKMLI